MNQKDFGALRLATRQEMPGSVLRERASDDSLIHKRPMFIGDRPRVSTCSDVIWSRNDTLITCKLSGQALHVFDFRDGQLIHRQTVHTQDRLRGIALSPDRERLAVTYSNPSFRVGVHRIHPDGTVEEDAEIVSEALGDRFVHSVNFSPDGKFLIVTHFIQQSNIALLDAKSLDVIRVMTTPYTESVVRFAKSVCFTDDSRFAIVAYSTLASGEPGATTATIAAHHYFPATGELSPPLCSVSEGLGNIECVEMLTDGSVLAVDQHQGAVFRLTFDADNVLLGSPECVLSCKDGLGSPHASAVSPHGIVAVADHTDDLVHLFIPA